MTQDWAIERFSSYHPSKLILVDVVARNAKGKAIKRAALFLFFGWSIKEIVNDFHVCTEKYKALVFYAQPYTLRGAILENSVFVFPDAELKLVSIGIRQRFTCGSCFVHLFNS